MQEEETVEVAETVETTETAETAEVETTETEEVDVAQLQATNKKLFERAKKAEAENKALKGQAPTETKTVSQPTNVEETVLLAQGINEELIEELKLRAPKYGGSLIKAQADPNYIAVKDRFEKEQKRKEASLGASRGAGSAKAQKTFNTPGLSRDEHRKMVLESR